jgi:hypothetical protein
MLTRAECIGTVRDPWAIACDSACGYPTRGSVYGEGLRSREMSQNGAESDSHIIGSMVYP